MHELRQDPGWGSFETIAQLRDLRKLILSGEGHGEGGGDVYER